MSSQKKGIFCNFIFKWVFQSQLKWIFKNCTPKTIYGDKLQITPNCKQHLHDMAIGSN